MVDAGAKVRAVGPTGRVLLSFGGDGPSTEVPMDEAVRILVRRFEGRVLPT